MTNYPSHFLPNWSSDAAADAIFHYTTAAGLAGIFKSRSIWGTAYYCANDEQELAAAKGVLTSLFREELFRLEKEKDPRITKFYRRGVDPTEYADHFEGLLTSLTLGMLCAYITCFCKPSGKEDFLHGLLSQWRGYGPDGGYALQFSRKKLEAALGTSKVAMYELADVHYCADSPLKEKLLSHKSAFVAAFNRHLDELAGPIDSSRTSWENPLPGLFGGPIEALLDHLVYTKNQHFVEERECRICLLHSTKLHEGESKINYFSRNGLLVPYIAILDGSFDVLDCVDWIVVGPSPRVQARFKSTTLMVQQSQKDIKVRASHIPYTRL